MSETQGMSSSSREPMSRRKVVKKAAAAALGAAGGSVLIGAIASGVSAESMTKSAFAPSVVFLSDTPAVAVDASLGNDFRLTLHASRTMTNPTNVLDGQKLIFQITQGGIGSNTIAWDDRYEFSASLPRPALSTKVGETDLLGFIYNKAKDKFLLAAFLRGFS